MIIQRVALILKSDLNWLLSHQQSWATFESAQPKKRQSIEIETMKTRCHILSCLEFQSRLENLNRVSEKLWSMRNDKLSQIKMAIFTIRALRTGLYEVAELHTRKKSMIGMPISQITKITWRFTLSKELEAKAKQWRNCAIWFSMEEIKSLKLNDRMTLKTLLIN
jgi:hypothetical protein